MFCGRKQYRRRETHKNFFFIDFKESALLLSYVCLYQRETCPGWSCTSAPSAAWGKSVSQGSVSSEIALGCELPQNIAYLK